jgi:hypothetical protein
MKSMRKTIAATGEHALFSGVVGWRFLLILLFFNMLVCACSGHVGWMLFWAIAFSSCAYEYGYEYGKTEERLSCQSACRTVL